MSQNHCPNSTNKLLYLDKITYPNDKTASYFITAEEAHAPQKEGKIPLFKLAADYSGPVIAIILAQEKHPQRAEKDYCIHPYYPDAIIQAGGNPVFFSYDNVKEQLSAINPDGILLIGGSFASSGEWYCTPTDTKADKRALAYLSAIEFAQEKHLPVLGICAGMQMIAGFAGAKMLPKVENHKKGGENTAHKVNIIFNSLLHNIIRQDVIETNSAHGEAVCDQNTGDCLITARAEDGIVEAIELKRPWNKFVLGVQWHPEFFCKKGDLPSLNIFKSFVEAAQNDKS